MEIFRLLNLGLLLGASFAPFVQADILPVAISGQPVPGFPDDVHYFHLETAFGTAFAPQIDETGNILFHALISGAGIGSLNRTVWMLGPAEQPALLIQSASEHSDLPDGTNIGVPWTPRMSRDGTLVFETGLFGSAINSGNDSGILLYRNGTLHLVAQEGDSPPPLEEPERFGSFGRVPWSGGRGAVVFSSLFIDVDPAGSSGQGLWRGSANGVSLVARTGVFTGERRDRRGISSAEAMTFVADKGMEATDSMGSVFRSFLDATMDLNGAIAFIASYGLADGSGNLGTGLWRTLSGIPGLERVIGTGDSLSLGLADKVAWVSDPRFGPNGQLVFRAALEVEVGEWIYGIGLQSSPGALVQWIAVDGESVFFLSYEGAVAQLQSASFSFLPDDSLLLRCDVDLVDGPMRPAVWRVYGEEKQLLLLAGEPILGESDESRFLGFGTILPVGLPGTGPGQSVFSAVSTDGLSLRSGLWYMDMDPSAVPVSLLQTGDSVELGHEDHRTVEAVYHPDPFRGANTHGDTVVAVRFTDQSSAVLRLSVPGLRSVRLALTRDPGSGTLRLTWPGGVDGAHLYEAIAPLGPWERVVEPPTETPSGCVWNLEMTEWNRYFRILTE